MQFWVWQPNTSSNSDGGCFYLIRSGFLLILHVIPQWLLLVHFPDFIQIRAENRICPPSVKLFSLFTASQSLAVLGFLLSSWTTWIYSIFLTRCIIQISFKMSFFSSHIINSSCLQLDLPKDSVDWGGIHGSWGFLWGKKEKKKKYNPQVAQSCWSYSCIIFILTASINNNVRSIRCIICPSPLKVFEGSPFYSNWWSSFAHNGSRNRGL